MPGFDTVWPADSVEFCPHPGAANIFACGTYKLDQSEQPAPISGNAAEENEETSEASASQKRRGKCILLQAGDNEDDDNLTVLQEISLPAIPDMKWCHRSDSAAPFLAVADSEGHVTTYELSLEECKLNNIQSVTCAEPHVLCLSLDWSNRKTPSTGLGSLVVSLSNGSLSVLQPNETELAITNTWLAHDYEPWVAAWNYWDSSIIYSGGDDLKLKAWDARQGFDQPVFVNRRFDAGVTCIQSHPVTEHLLAVGSYDSTVRVFDTRKLQSPLIQAEVGGGAWRVKWHPSPERKNDLLVACMHDNFKVVHFDLDSASYEIAKRFDEHKSLAYGADWSLSVNQAGTLIASCSFYDHLLHTWRG